MFVLIFTALLTASVQSFVARCPTQECVDKTIEEAKQSPHLIRVMVLPEDGKLANLSRQPVFKPIEDFWIQ